MFMNISINESAEIFMSAYPGEYVKHELTERFVLRKTSTHNYIVIMLSKEQLCYLHFVQHFIATITTLKTSSWKSDLFIILIFILNILILKLLNLLTFNNGWQIHQV